MIATSNLSIERLYLDKDGGEEIFIDTCPLPQHQIDGIRFLFRQFKKKKPGVILNNPEGYGKTVQVALFLNAVRGLIKNPVLIVCKDEKEVNNWIQTLKTWTKYTIEDMAVESSNVYDKKTIFLKKATDIVKYDRRDWSIMVVKSDVTPKDLMRVNFKVAFKVWLTTIDMRKDLKMLNSIYGWMYSEKKFDVQNLLDPELQHRGPLDRSKLLDAFLEDVVIMRNDFPTPFKASHRNTLQILPKITRKNKDATGTKIKRSKKRIEEEQALLKKNESLSEYSSFESDKSIKEDPKKPITDLRIDECLAKGTFRRGVMEMDIEAFIRHKDPREVICKEYESFNTDLNEKSDANSEDISFADAAQDIVDNENQMVVDDTAKESEIVEMETIGENSEETTKTVDKTNPIAADDGSNSESLLTNFSVIAEFKADTENVESDKIKATSDVNLNVIKVKIEKLNSNEIVEVPSIKENIIAVVNKDDTSICELGIGKDGSTGEPVVEEKIEKNKRDIDNKISELEEQAFKKFKGTLLDSLF